MAVELPWLGTIDVRQIGLPLFTALLGVVDGFNPCATWVLLILLSALTGIHDRRKLIAVAQVRPARVLRGHPPGDRMNIDQALDRVINTAAHRLFERGHGRFQEMDLLPEVRAVLVELHEYAHGGELDFVLHAGQMNDARWLDCIREYLERADSSDDPDYERLFELLRPFMESDREVTVVEALKLAQVAGHRSTLALAEQLGLWPWPGP